MRSARGRFYIDFNEENVLVYLLFPTPNAKAVWVVWYSYCIWLHLVLVLSLILRDAAREVAHQDNFIHVLMLLFVLFVCLSTAVTYLRRMMQPLLPTPLARPSPQCAQPASPQPCCMP
jgi:hypothetical protein